jgi:rubrerythrin
MTIKSYISDDKKLMSEWDYDSNIGLDPNKLTKGSNKRANWKCNKCGHRWNTKIGNRTYLQRGCPCCCNHIIVPGINDLKTKHPDLAKEWDLTKNGDLTPEMVPCGTNKKVWWKCPIGHEYKASILHRAHGTNCPICNSGRQTSFAEQTVFYYVKKLYPDAISRYKADFLGRMELDIYIPSIRYAIEYDGEAWHKKEKIKREQNKYLSCEKQNIKLIRLRERMADLGSDIADYQYGTNRLYEHKNLEIIVRKLLSHIYFGNPVNVDINIKRDEFVIRGEYLTKPSKNLENSFPEIAKEWHPTKNGNLTPDMFTPGSDHHKFWWKCQICGYEYKSNIGHRTNKKNATSCPKCGIEKSTQAKRISVNMIDQKTKSILKTFISISDASRQMKINSSNICMVCKGQRPNAGGYIWEYTKATS